MDIKDFTVNLQNIYEEMSRQFSDFQSASGLGCLSGCGRCCQFPEIEASALEMLPFAWKIYQQGLLEQWLEKFEQTEQKSCLFFAPEGSAGNGRCTQYEVRPSVCRMFGVAGYFNKLHQVGLSVCKYIKEQNGEAVKQAEKELLPENVPMLTEWSSRLSSVHPFINQERLPINQATHQALQMVANYAQYH